MCTMLVKKTHSINRTARIVIPQSDTIRMWLEDDTQWKWAQKREQSKRAWEREDKKGERSRISLLVHSSKRQNEYLSARTMWLNKTWRHIKYLTLKALELRISLFCLIKCVSHRPLATSNPLLCVYRDQCQLEVLHGRRCWLNVMHTCSMPNSYQILFTNVIMRLENSLKNSSNSFRTERER